MRITILTQYYPPEHGAPQNRLHDLAKRLVAAGDEVTVLTAMPNYPRGEVFREYRGKLTAAEELDGVRIVRSWISASKSKGTAAQLAVYFSFVFSSLLVGFLKLRRSDFLIVESPPLFLGFTAILLKFAKRAKLVTNVSDLWPESAVQLGIIGPGIILSTLEWFEKTLYKHSTLVSCQTEGIVGGVKKRLPEAATILFPNGVDTEMFTIRPRSGEIAEELEIPENAFVVGYGGNHGRSQALSRVLEAAAIVRGSRGDILFLLCGDGPEKPELVEKASKMGLDNVRFVDSQPREKMADIQSVWDIALVPLKDIDIFEGARPSKMFELMAGGIPFVFCGKGEGADIAVESGCAVSVPPENPAELADAVLRFAELAFERRREMGAAGRRFVEEHFNRARLAENLRGSLAAINGGDS
ncbi:MAG: glycosyltransferase family 4 protein [Kiritimatiellaeota bacterium]|nr:glycosyltransferase family 4 protein [Kiritimatiellota bacterium]